jgi:hypothetical protein
VVQHHEEKFKNVQSIGPLETEQWVNVTVDAMAMHLFSIYQNKVVQRHASLLDPRRKEREPSTNLRVPPKSKSNK